VHVVRRGGIAGLAVSATVDSAELPADAVAALEQAVRGSGGTGPAGADRFRYELTVGEGVAARRAVLEEHEVPGALAPLLDRLASDGTPGL
jgi:hypothetical protein